MGFLLIIGLIIFSSAANADTLIKSDVAEVTTLDYRARLNQIPIKDQFGIVTNLDHINKLVQNLYVTKALAAEARANKLDQSEIVQAEIKLVTDRLLVKKRIEQIVKNIQYLDLDDRAYELYQINQKDYKIPESIQASHILISTKDREDKKALEHAEFIHDLVTSQDNDFEEIALEYSDAPSVKKNKGDLGFFTPEKMVKPFSDVAFSLKNIGDISEPVKTQFGYHIILLKDRRPERTVPFAEVKAKIVKKLKADHEAIVKTDYFNKIKSNPNIIVNAEEIRKQQVIIKPNQIPKE